MTKLQFTTLEDLAGTSAGKGMAIIKGLREQSRKEHPELDTNCREFMICGELAYICAELTSSRKSDREWAKKKIRELVTGPQQREEEHGN